jgi:hypothetical protein
MTKLDRVTIVCVDCKFYGQSANALLRCLGEVTPTRCLLLTDIYLELEGVEVVQIDPIKTIEDYSQFIIKKLWKYIETDFCLIVQWDGYVLNGDLWLDEFYDYSFVGAPWLYRDKRNVGNAGFCLISKELLNILGNDDFIQICSPDDEIIGRLYRHYLEENYSIKFPSEELADKFSFELRQPTQKTFGFHGHFHEPYKEWICISRQASLGDLVQVEPVMRYYNEHGYRVILHTLPQFYNLFLQHDFPVYHPNQVDPRIKYRTINLDMSYESKPKQLHLKSYFEFCGITHYELKNPKLKLSFDPKYYANKFFSKYCVIHIDSIPQEARNIQGDIDWEVVASTLKAKGYTVIQIGKGDKQVIKNAIQMQTPTEGTLMWVVGGADLFIGIDSGPSNVAVAYNIPSILFFGSVEPKYIHADLSNIEVIELNDVCNNPKCWHSVIGCEGVICTELGKKKITLNQGRECQVEVKHPPCVQFRHEQLMKALKRFI